MMTYSVPEISCGHCKETIEKAVSAVAGIASVSVSIEKKAVTVDFGSAKESDVIAAIEEAGYDVAGVATGA